MAVKLVPPCGYVGGKRRYAERIAADILARRPQRVWDVCTGSGAVTLALLSAGLPASSIVCVEQGPWGWVWRDVAAGTFDVARFRDVMGEVARMDQREVAGFVETTVASWEPSSISFLVLQAASYGSTPVWWDGAAWRRGDPSANRFFKARGFWEPGPDSAEKNPRGTIFTPLKIADAMQRIADAARGLTVIHGDAVEHVDPIAGDVVYVDPPYSGTSGYGFSLDVTPLIDRCRSVPLLISEGRSLAGASSSVSLDDRKRGSLAGSGATSGNQEWLNWFEPSITVESSFPWEMTLMG